MKRRKIYENKETDSAFTVHRNDAGPPHRGMGASGSIGPALHTDRNAECHGGRCPLTVTTYNVVYVANPVAVKSGSTYTYDYQSMNIYVPSNATENSPIILQDNNGGWNGGKAGTSVVPDALCNTTASTTGATACNQKTAVALKAGYVIANVGCRSRSSGAQDLDGNYIAHSPAQVVDVKAAIRYLRHNDAAMLGTTNRIIITGTSGGGALGVAIAASGNSPDYYSYLYELGAAGVTYNAHRGTYSSTLKDDIFGTVLYCPITDLDHMDAAYEWMYKPPGRNSAPTYWAAPAHPLLHSTVGCLRLAEGELCPYFNRLGLRDENGKTTDRPPFPRRHQSRSRERSRESVS